MHSEPTPSRDRRPRLTPAIADVRRAVREAIAPFSGRRVLVALSGGADSLALAAATAFEAPRAGIEAGAVIVDHDLQAGSADVATRAAAQATALGLHPARTIRVRVDGAGGLEAAAREARYAALAAASAELDAAAVLLGHTLDDQAETVLLGLARGSGATSLQGMATADTRTIDGHRVHLLRPLLAVRRATTVQCCADSGLDPWHDPHNDDPAFARVRVRDRVLPLLEAELGPGIAPALARTAEQLREDATVLDDLTAAAYPAIVTEALPHRVELDAAGLAAQPAAVAHRLIRLVAAQAFGQALHRSHTLEVARLVTDWRGQGPLHLPGIRVERAGGVIRFTSATGHPVSATGHPDAAPAAEGEPWS